MWRVLTHVCRTAAILTSLLGVSCSSPLEPSASLTETFSGTLTQQGASTHTFSVVQNGAARITLVSLAPFSNVTVGMGAGTVGDGTCILTASDVRMRPGETLTAELGAGTSCVVIYDVGDLSGLEPISYSLEVVHT